MKESPDKLPRSFFYRRLHSLFGLLIVLFLIEHLLTNSQAALLFGENGQGFIHAVNFIKNLPYLPAIEILLIGVPIAFHAGIGIKYLFTGKFNSFPSDGSRPSLTKYGRNQAYTWHRIAAWILLVGIIAHVSYMRFYRYPSHAQIGETSVYFTRISVDEGLYTVAKRLGVTLFDQSATMKEKKELQQLIDKNQTILQQAALLQKEQQNSLGSKEQKILVEAQLIEQKKQYVKALMYKPLGREEVMAEAKDFGTATLLMVRDSFKSPFKAALYTIFVIAACFHAFNGLWTFCITWGVVIKARSQKKLVNLCIGLMVLIAFLGLASIWGTYWINLAR